TKTKARFQAGTVPKSDVLKAQVDVSQATNDAIANERAQETARASLNRLLGRTGGASVETTESLEVPGPLAALDRLEALPLPSRPEIQSLAAQRQGAKVATQLAKQYWLPDVNLTLTRNAMDGAPTTFTTGIGFSFPILLGQHEKGEVATAVHHEV